MRKELAVAQEKWIRLLNGNMLSRFNNRASSELVRDYELDGRHFICMALKYRMTSLAIGLRLYQKEFGELPQSLAQLRPVGIEPSEMRTLSNSSFGFESTPLTVRILDEDRSWQQSAIPSAIKYAEWEWTLDAWPRRN